MDIPPPDPTKLLAAWMEWERGDNPPGRTLATLKTGGLRVLLEKLAAESPAADVAADALVAEGDTGPSTEAWTPIV